MNTFDTPPTLPPAVPQRSFGLLPRVLAAQVLAFGLTLVVGWGYGTLFDPSKLPVWWVILVQSASAAMLSRLFGLKRWWLVAQFALPTLAWVVLAFAVPSWVYLVIFLGLFLVYSNASRERVPLYLTNATTCAALSQLISDDNGDEKRRFIDLGCGLAGTISALSRAHPNWDFVGVENAPLPYLISRLRLLGRVNARVEFKSLWSVDLSQFDMVYAFLSPAPMPRLIASVERDMKPGSQFISNSFWAPNLPFDDQVEVTDRRKTRLFIKIIE